MIEMLSSRLQDRTFIIAEAGVNHNGDIDLAVEMIQVASRCGVDAIKFQAFIPEKSSTYSLSKDNDFRSNPSL